MSPADEAWVKELYEANALKLYKVAFRRLGDKDEAENVVQEAFLLLLARFDTVRVHPNPSGWLMKVVQNLIRHSMDRNQTNRSCSRWVRPGGSISRREKNCFGGALI